MANAEFVDDQWLVEELTKFDVPVSKITDKNRDILIKKLNHMRARQRAGKAPPSPLRRQSPGRGKRSPLRRNIVPVDTYSSSDDNDKPPRASERLKNLRQRAVDSGLTNCGRKEEKVVNSPILAGSLCNRKAASHSAELASPTFDMTYIVSGGALSSTRSLSFSSSDDNDTPPRASERLKNLRQRVVDSGLTNCGRKEEKVATPAGRGDSRAATDEQAAASRRERRSIGATSNSPILANSDSFQRPSCSTLYTVNTKYCPPLYASDFSFGNHYV